jgi:hypothetical protein
VPLGGQQLVRPQYADMLNTARRRVISLGVTLRGHRTVGTR